jgi:arginyl-tRNA synthetase
MVALSPAAASELGFEITGDEKQKSFVEMSGRKGLGVKADDLLDRLETKALEEVKKRQPETLEDEIISIAKKIAVGALRYFLLKFTRNTVVVFDFDEALAFEGETGVYCQYSAVRLNSIFKKLDAGAVKEAFRLLDADNTHGSKVLSENAEIWNLLMNAGRLDDVLLSAEASAEPAILAKYAFNLSRAFNLFYHNHKILTEKDPTKKAVLLLTADIARQSLGRALDTLGIPVPEKM